jgi:hypothetical protein
MHAAHAHRTPCQPLRAVVRAVDATVGGEARLADAKLGGGARLAWLARREAILCGGAIHWRLACSFCWCG